VFRVYIYITLLVIPFLFGNRLIASNEEDYVGLIKKCFESEENFTCEELLRASKYGFDTLNRFDLASETVIQKMKSCLENEENSNSLYNYAILNTYVALNYSVIGNIDSSAVYYKLADQIISQNEYNDLLFWFELKKFTFYQKKGNFSTAIINLEYIFKNYSELLSLKSNVRLCNLLGYYYERIGKTKQSVEYFFKAVKLVNELGDLHLSAVIHNNIGNSYALAGDIQTAKMYFENGISIFKKSNAEMTVPMLYNNLARLYEQMGHSDTALLYYEKCLSQTRSVGNNSVAEVETNISSVFLSNNNIDSSLYYINLAITHSKLLGENSREHIHAIHMLAMIEKEIGNLGISRELLSQSYYLSESVGMLREMEMFSKELSDLYYLDGRKDSALQFLNTHLLLKDSLSGQSSKEKLIAKIEEEKLDSMKVRTQLLEADKEYLNLEISKRNTVVTLISCLLFCVLLLIIVLIRGHRRKKLLMEYQLRESEATIYTKNKELIGAKLEIAAQSEALNELNKKIRVKLSEKYDPEFDDLSIILKQSSHFSNSAERKKYINNLIKIDSTFYNKLKAAQPLLTEDELRLSALIRLNLPSEEIVDIFRISKASLNTKRYRLRKKLSLKKEQNLEEFIRLL